MNIKILFKATALFVGPMGSLIALIFLAPPMVTLGLIFGAALCGALAFSIGGIYLVMIGEEERRK